jgi:hypothetical protein
VVDRADLAVRSLGNSGGRPRGIPLSVRGEFYWPPMGILKWPLTVASSNHPVEGDDVPGADDHNALGEWNQLFT